MMTRHDVLLRWALTVTPVTKKRPPSSLYVPADVADHRVALFSFSLLYLSLSWWYVVEGKAKGEKRLCCRQPSGDAVTLTTPCLLLATRSSCPDAAMLATPGWGVRHMRHTVPPDTCGG